jgi:CubicO group peptidase (beta-lactamase class C family)
MRRCAMAVTREYKRAMACARFLGCMLALTATIAAARPGGVPYPREHWSRIDPTLLGWSQEQLAAVRKYVETLPPASVVVIDHGREIAEWGDAGKRIKISSMRKSLLSALYGIYLPGSGFDLDATLDQLGVDDDPPLTAEEKHATVRMLLEARSGIYHGYVAGTPGMREGWPKRGSHTPGSFWFYNNWDFNALGTIFETEFKTSIAHAFEDRIALPIGMEDFRSEDMYYLSAPADALPDFNKSIHPAYHFRLSARDVARFGYLFLRSGNWNAKQVVGRAWVDESTTMHSRVGSEGGYGYLWWTDGFGLAEKSFSAQGALAKYLVVVPRRELVIVYLNHTEFPDDASGLTSEDVKRLPTITHEQMGHFVKLLLEAKQGTHK